MLLIEWAVETRNGLDGRKSVRIVSMEMGSRVLTSDGVREIQSPNEPTPPLIRKIIGSRSCLCGFTYLQSFLTYG